MMKTPNTENMMNEHFNQLTPAEAERLAILSEECAEVIQIIGKILRHGYESTHPKGGPTNRDHLELELGDVLCIGRMMSRNGDVEEESIEEHASEKLSRLFKYAHHQEPQQAGVFYPDGRVVQVAPENGSDFTLQELYDAIGCEMVEMVGLPGGNIMLVDEEGLLNGKEPNIPASSMANRPIVGAALVCDGSMMR